MDKDFVIIVVFGLLIALVAIVVFIAWIWPQAVRARRMLDTWAAQGGFQIIRFERKNWTNRGPFGWWTNSPYQMIFHIRVRDREGKARSAWVRCGSYLGGKIGRAHV